MAQGGICVGNGQKAGPLADGKKGPPDKSRSTTITSVLGH
jgi:hypothetical protein